MVLMLNSSGFVDFRETRKKLSTIFILGEEVEKLGWVDVLLDTQTAPIVL